MLPDVGLSEYLVIAVVALIVVGPKDLPVLLRKLGQWVAKMRNMASEFRASFDEMARQSELDELRKEVEAMRQGQLMSPAALVDEHAGSAEIKQTFADIEAGLKGGEVMMHPPMGANAPAETHVSAQDVIDSQPQLVTGPAEAKAPAKPRRPRTTTKKKA
jgi:sec-independent protein translocase protein TatB